MQLHEIIADPHKAEVRIADLEADNKALRGGIVIVDCCSSCILYEVRINDRDQRIAELEAELKEARQRSYVMSLRNGWKKAEELEAELGRLRDNIHCLHERIADLEAERDKWFNKYTLELKDRMLALHQLSELEAELALKDKMVQVLAEDAFESEVYVCEDGQHPQRWDTLDECLQWATAKAKENEYMSNDYFDCDCDECNPAESKMELCFECRKVNKGVICKGCHDNKIAELKAKESE